jgi:hypothetical protein
LFLFLLDSSKISMGRVPLSKNFEDADSRFNLNEVKQRWWFYTASPYGAVCAPCFMQLVALKKAGRRPTGVSNPARDSCKLREHALEKHSAGGVTYPKGEAAFFGRYLQKQIDEKQWSVAPPHAAPMHGTNEEEEGEAGGGRRRKRCRTRCAATKAAPDEESRSKKDGMSKEDRAGGDKNDDSCSSGAEDGTAPDPWGDDQDGDFPTGGGGGGDEDDGGDKKRKGYQRAENEHQSSASVSATSSRDDGVELFEPERLRKKCKCVEDGAMTRVGNATAEAVRVLSTLPE